MTNRQSINGPRERHDNPIPNASRVGPLIMSSVVTGINQATRELPDSLEEQITNVYAHIRSDVEAAGATLEDVVKITFWLKDPAAQRHALNAEWLRMFPDPQSRPARHTLTLPSESKGKVQADFVAFVQ
ncbi:hypothetical protein BZM27_16100 [Paraburkholderia steynii]|uniref:Enamine deaminase RidA n=1 Tax=Paraburkholderia steynii TaxID=1245441 RepID=A0A4V2NH93_9BURK|nr:hypothetical protein BZM27_16100 [Paraburkholderia steynii]